MERQKIEYMKFLNHMEKLLTSEHISKPSKHFPVLDVISAGIFSELRRLEHEEYCKDPKNH
ncbi:MAG: hypothetical protein IJS39_13385 [Synergistaceae bacterium]|nr:hypothetical protein [Synergistaceae bacterium]